MKEIIEQQKKEQARKAEILPKIGEIEKTLKGNWNGTDFDRLLGYKEELLVIDSNASIFEGVLSKPSKLDKTNLESNKTKVYKEIQSLEKELKDLEKKGEKFGEEYSEEPLSSEENKILKDINSINLKLPILKGNYRTYLLCLKHV